MNIIVLLQTSPVLVYSVRPSCSRELVVSCGSCPDCSHQLIFGVLSVRGRGMQGKVGVSPRSLPYQHVPGIITGLTGHWAVCPASQMKVVATKSLWWGQLTSKPGRSGQVRRHWSPLSPERCMGAGGLEALPKQAAGCPTDTSGSVRLIPAHHLTPGRR